MKCEEVMEFWWMLCRRKWRGSVHVLWTMKFCDEALHGVKKSVSWFIMMDQAATSGVVMLFRRKILSERVTKMVVT